MPSSILPTQATLPRAHTGQRAVGADKPDKRHVVFSDRLWLAPGTNSTVVAHCSIGFLISIRTPRAQQKNGAVKTKSQMIRDALAAGDQIAALRIAAHFQDRSAATLTYKRGLDAYNHPAFYRQLGQNPEQLTATALALLESNFILRHRCTRG